MPGPDPRLCPRGGPDPRAQDLLFKGPKFGPILGVGMALCHHDWHGLMPGSIAPNLQPPGSLPCPPPSPILTKPQRHHHRILTLATARRVPYPAASSSLSQPTSGERHRSRLTTSLELQLLSGLNGTITRTLEVTW